MIKKMIILVLWAFLPSILAFDNSSNPRAWEAYQMIMQKYRNQTSSYAYKHALSTYNSQFEIKPPLPPDQIVSFQETLKEYQLVSDQLLQKAGNIIYQSIDEMIQNPKGEYYIWNATSQLWHLPHQVPPTLEVDGAALNSNMLTEVINTKLQQDLRHENSNLIKRSWFSFTRRVKPGKVLDPDSIKLGWRRGIFGRARLKSEIKLFFKPTIIKAYFGVGLLLIVYFICKDVIFGAKSAKNEATNQQSLDMEMTPSSL